MRLNGLVLGDRDTDNHEKKCHFSIILWAGGLILNFHAIDRLFFGTRMDEREKRHPVKKIGTGNLRLIE
jgi:hypothetical protein